MEAQNTLRTLMAAVGNLDYKNVEQVVRIANRFTYSVAVQSAVCKAMWTIATWRQLQGCVDIFEADGIRVILNAMDYHPVSIFDMVLNF